MDRPAVTAPRPPAVVVPGPPAVVVPGPPAVAVLGPTASGKTTLAVALARHLRGEVVNVDAMQLYRGMDTGTAKATPAERAGVPHHLLDELEVWQEASVSAFQRRAREVVAEVAARDRVPVLVGGSGLYVRAVLDDLRFPGTDPVLRASLEADAARDGPQALHDRLAALDPEAAAVLPAANVRRVVRALEVVTLTGRPFAATLPGPSPVVPAVRLALDVPRPELDRRIDERVEAMFAAGLVAEVVRLAEAGLRRSRTASRAVGYAQVLAALDAGEDPGGEPVRAEVARATRRLARRQGAWLRRDPLVRWLPAGDGEDPRAGGAGPRACWARRVTAARRHLTG